MLSHSEPPWCGLRLYSLYTYEVVLNVVVVVVVVSELLHKS
jgi:hypothetical protein